MVTSAAGTTASSVAPLGSAAATAYSSTPPASTTGPQRPARTKPPPPVVAVAVMPSATSVPVTSPAAIAACHRPPSAARTIGRNCVNVGSKGPGAITRPSSSTTTASSTNPRPSPPCASSIVRPSQSRPARVRHSSSAAAKSPVSTIPRTSVTGHSFTRTARTAARSSSCSAVKSSCTERRPSGDDSLTRRQILASGRLGRQWTAARRSWQRSGRLATAAAAIADLVTAGVESPAWGSPTVTIDEHLTRMGWVRAAAVDAGRTVAVLADLPGPRCGPRRSRRTECSWPRTRSWR